MAAAPGHAVLLEWRGAAAHTVRAGRGVSAKALFYDRQVAII